MTNRLILEQVRGAFRNAVAQQPHQHTPEYLEAIAQASLEQLARARSRKEACDVAERIIIEIASSSLP